MKNAFPISKKLFNIYLLFTREPITQYLFKDLEYFTNGNGRLLGLINFDITDEDYYACILSRDKSMQYRAELVEASIETIEAAREWIDEKMANNLITYHDDNKLDYFDVFKELQNQNKQHPHYKLLKDGENQLAAKETIKEVSYHYKDIDGNFIDQFQSLNGFDSRIWELFLFCFFREQSFSFRRDFEAPDYLIEKFGNEIAIEAVIISRKNNNIENFVPKSDEEIEELLSKEIPLMFGSSLFDKVKKRYWEKDHVKGKSFLIAIADFHDTMSMTWTSNGLVDYLYGYKYDHSFDEKGNLIITPTPLENYRKENGTEIPTGFFFQSGNEYVSAIIFSAHGTVAKFNRMGKQAGLGNKANSLIRFVTLYNHAPNAVKPIFTGYEVNEDSNETWSEGVIIYHNPNAKIPLDPDLFDNKVAQCFFEEKMIKSFMPEIFPYSSFTYNMLFVK